MDLDKKNYYEVLEISVNSSPQEIERAYIRAKNSYSGDSVAMYSLMSIQECESILSQIEEAYTILGFPDKRKEYDRVRGYNQDEKALSSPLTKSAYVSPKPQSQPTMQEDLVASTMREQPQIEKSAQFRYEDYSSNQSEARVSKVTALKKFQLDYPTDSSMERRIEEATDFPGSFLKEIREYKKVTIERMSDMMKISKTYLNAIENDDLKKLPAEVYIRGFVLQYAKCLKLNAEVVATSYMHHLKKIKSS
jgi:curved DNA-binding protein CbpA